MNILHAETDPSLLDRLRQMLSSSAHADIAVGYFFISGFEAVADEIARQRKVRILVGRTDRHVLEEVAAGLQQAEALQEKLGTEDMPRRREIQLAAAAAAHHVAVGVSQLPQTDGSKEAVRKFRDLVASKQIEVKAYPRGTLHAKAYLCWYENHAELGAAIVGSSNFTLAGLGGNAARANTELNVRVTGDDEMKELKLWFDALWAESKDISDELQTQLSRSWAIAQTPPYHVYLKTLYELYRERLMADDSTLAPQGDVELVNFQRDAVNEALNVIDQYGGVYVADVVGLGKSYIGAEILRQLGFLDRREGPPLIICPKNLVPQWERYNEMFKLGAEVLSQSMIAPPPDTQYDEETGEILEADEPQYGINLLEKYRNRGPVLVDEAHNFRNITGRYRGLKDYLDKSEHKVILMGATPQNLGPRDIYRQLSLFLDEVDHGVKIEPVALADFFNAAELWYEFEVEYRDYSDQYNVWSVKKRGAPPVEPQAPKVPRVNLEDLLKPLVIRRRRRDIRELYPDAMLAGKPLKFIDPVLSNVPYRLDKVYGAVGTFEEIKAALGRHSAARYRASEYLKAAAKKKNEYVDLLRAQNRIAALMNSLLAKRLESSVAAFRSTVDELMRSNRNFRASLGKKFVPIGRTATRLLQGASFDPDRLLEELKAEEQARQGGQQERLKLVNPVEDFEIDRWAKDIDSDYEVLADLKRRADPVKPKDDDKLQALVRFLKQPDVRNEKVLIFSEAETTVEYLYENLNPGGRASSIARLSGQTRGSLGDTVKRFSPKAQLRQGERMPGPEIRVLIATDVISEGQNLQDCFRVINYDLHWNPIRLVQRFGRVDRIGQERAPQLHNFWPDTAIDEHLDLTERLIGRIQMFHDLIGLDSRLLSAAEKLNYGAMFRIYAEQKSPDQSEEESDPLAVHQRGASLLHRIQETDPDLWETIMNLPDGIRSALKMADSSTHLYQANAAEQSFVQKALNIEGSQLTLQSPGKSGAGSLFDGPRTGETAAMFSSAGVVGTYAVDGDLTVRQVSAAQMLEAVECAPDTPAAAMPPNTGDRVMAAYAEFRASLKQRLGKSRPPGSESRVWRYLRKEFANLREQFANEPDQLKRIEQLRLVFSGQTEPRVIDELRLTRDSKVSGMALIRRLDAIRNYFRLSPSDPDAEEPQAEPTIVRIVCSDGLVGD